MERLPVIYVAGPFDASTTAWRREENIHTAERRGLAIWRGGGAAIVPHALGRYYVGEVPEALAGRVTAELLLRCDGILATVIDENLSRGTRREVELALRVGIPRWKWLGNLLVDISAGRVPIRAAIEEERS